jgi:hypothetical protein
MTIGGWVLFGLLTFFIVIMGAAIAIDCGFTTRGCVITTLIITVIILALLFGMLWYFNNTAAGQRALIDQQSNLNNGMERTVTVYTANGDLIAQYVGLIDIDTNDGGYVKFDFEGKRYIYYNCFIETIADIG